MRGFAGGAFWFRGTIFYGSGTWPGIRLEVLHSHRIRASASALSKESGLVFSALAIGLILLRKIGKGIVAIGAAIAFVLTIYLALRTQVPRVDVPQLSPPAPALVRPIIAARALAEYTGLLIAPVNLHMERDVENHPWGYNPASLTAGAWRELETLAGLVVFGVVLWWAYRAFNRAPATSRFLSAPRSHTCRCPVCFRYEYCRTLDLRPVSLCSSRNCTGVALIVRARTNLSSVSRSLPSGSPFLECEHFTAKTRVPGNVLCRTVAAGGDSARMLINSAGSSYRMAISKKPPCSCDARWRKIPSNRSLCSILPPTR